MKPTQSTEYAKSGVDIHAGDSFSQLSATICRNSYNNSPHVRVYDMSDGNFRGPRGFLFQNLPAGYVHTKAPDGNGTKVIISSASGNFRRSPADLLAMSMEDISCWGGISLVYSDILDTRRVGKPGTPCFLKHQELMIGLGELVAEHNIVLLNGELAEMPDCVTSENPRALVQYNWCGVMTGAYHPDKMILGKTMKPGQAVVALRDGFRANGISLVRRALRRRFGKKWWSNPKAREAIQQAGLPSVIYSSLFTHLNGWHEKDFAPDLNARIHFISHLSGGSIKGKFAEMLFRLGLSAELDNLHLPPDIMFQCAQWLHLPDEECYSTWNGGQGALVVIDAEDVTYFIEVAKEFGIEAKLCGEITKRKHPQVRIRSQFSSKTVIFKPE